MAPKPKGFMNLTGYLLPGAVIVAAGAGLLALIARRKAAVAKAEGSGGLGGAPAVAASAEEMEVLRRALSEVED